MRVLIVTSLYPNPLQPRRAAFNRQQFRALAVSHEVRIIAPIAWPAEWSARRAAGELPADRRLGADGMDVHHPCFRYPPGWLRRLHGRCFVASVRRTFRDAVRGTRPDVVLGCWAYPDAWAAWRLAREAGLPVAIKLHGSDVLTLDRHAAKRRRTLEALHDADGVIAVSRNVRERALALGADPARTHVVRNGVDTSVFHPGPRAEARRRLGLGEGRLVLAVGNLVPVKGFDLLIAALAHSGVGPRCVIIGDGPQRNSLQSQIDGAGLGSRVRLLGAVAQPDLADWYRAADLLVLPSRSEGIPNVLLEAAASGLPFIASDVGGVPEIAEPGTLFQAGDAGSLAGTLRGALARIPGPPRLLIPRTSWAESATALSEVLRAVTASRTAALAR